MDAFLDASGNVIATSRVPREISEVKAEGVVERIQDAPDTIRHRNKWRAAIYHRKIGGDGTQIADYEEVEDGDGVQWRKDERHAEIDTNTNELLKQGFAYDGYTFSFGDAFRANIVLLMVAMREKAITYPAKINTVDNRHQYELKNRGKMRRFFQEYFAAFHRVHQAGEDLKEQIQQATSLAAVNAIEDTRTIENPLFIYPADYYVFDYGAKKRIEEIRAYGTDNGDGTYSDLAYVETYNYSGWSLLSVTRQYYWNDGTEAGDPEEIKYYRDDAANIEIRKGGFAVPFE
jgi:hypothetical protein